MSKNKINTEQRLQMIDIIIASIIFEELSQTYIVSLRVSYIPMLWVCLNWALHECQPGQAGPQMHQLTPASIKKHHASGDTNCCKWPLFRLRIMYLYGNISQYPYVLP